MTFGAAIWKSMAPLKSKGHTKFSFLSMKTLKQY